MAITIAIDHWFENIPKCDHHKPFKRIQLSKEPLLGFKTHDFSKKHNYEIFFRKF